MIFNFPKVALPAILFTAAMWSSDATGSTCLEQEPCIKFTQETATTNLCGLTGCVKKVCLCFKNDGEGSCTIDNWSHVCDAADGAGCQYSPLALEGGDVSNPAPLLYAEGKFEAFSGNCMCQFGSPGDDLYWVVKKGRDEFVENGLDLDTHCEDASLGDSNIRCFRADNTNTALHPIGSGCGAVERQKTLERVWRYDIASNAQCGADPCDCDDTNCGGGGGGSSTTLPTGGSTPATPTCIDASCVLGEEHHPDCADAKCVDDNCGIVFKNGGNSCSDHGAYDGTDNPCHTGNVCAEGLCVPQFKNADTICGQDETCVKDKCQAAAGSTVDGEMTCQVRTVP